VNHLEANQRQRLGDLNQPARTLRLGKSRCAIPIAIARGLRLSGSQVESLVSQPAPAVGTYFPSETLEQSLLRSKSKELVAPVIWMK
jgi:hypothetical protein